MFQYPAESTILPILIVQIEALESSTYRRKSVNYYLNSMELCRRSL